MSPSPSRSADRWLADSAAALSRASSYHVSGMLDPGLSIDLRVTPRGEQGTMSYHGVTWNAIAFDGLVWLQGAALWKATLAPDRAAALGDSWVQVSDDAAAFGWAHRLPTLPRAMPGIVFGPHPGLRVTGTVTLAGRSAVELRGDKDIYDVAATGTPYPLRWLEEEIPGPDGKPCGIVLDRFDEPVTLAPPAVVAATLTLAPSPGP